MGAYDCDCINNLEYDRREQKKRERLANSQSTAGQLNDGARSTAQSTDLIDRRQAIDRFNVIRPVDPKKDEYTKGIDVGIAMCIVAVKDQPTIQPEKAQLFSESTTSDLISRTETVERIRGVLDVTVPITDYDGGYVDGVEVGVSTVSTMPPAQPEPKEGHWIEGKIYRDVIECYCSECGQLMTTAASVRMNYCPNCGAKMINK